MIQGTNSNAGKSVLVAGLCRLFARRGVAVEPFKPQNMSNNAAVAADGGEIGRAQALQAMAAGVAPSVHHNPVLLKPESDTGSQVIIQGKIAGNLTSDRFGHRRDELLPKVLESFEILRARADIVIVEGAGSPAETNLRKGDIANMGFAEAAGVAVLLAGDIDRGGVIANLVGTHLVLNPTDRLLVAGFLINKFRGSVGLFDDGLDTIRKHTGWPSLGVVTWAHSLAALPAEDAVELSGRISNGSVTIAVPMLSRIANFDDIDPLSLEPDVDVVMVPPGQPIPAVDIIILPGTKSTIADLAFLRAQGWHIDIEAHVRRGGQLIGLCGGYQMLGRTISDPDGVEGPPGKVKGLGFLDLETVLHEAKVTRRVQGTHAGSGHLIQGYEIHVGETTGPATSRPFLRIDEFTDGAVSDSGRVMGGYVHGLFGSDSFRSHFLSDLGAASTGSYNQTVNEALETWADQLEEQLDIEALIAISKRRFGSRR